jgi:hypothetical protein
MVSRLEFCVQVMYISIIHPNTNEISVILLSNRIWKFVLGITVKYGRRFAHTIVQELLAARSLLRNSSYGTFPAALISS